MIDIDMGRGGLAATLALAVALAVPAAAQDDESFEDFSALDLEALLNTEVEVGAGFKQSIQDVPAVVDVMHRARIEALGVRDLNELMLRLTGVDQSHGNLFPFVQNPSTIRGGGVNDRILVIIDDHPQLDEMDEIYSPYAIPIEAIERVEFLRGPAAVLYGSSSMAGVLRIVTRQPETSGAGGTVVAGPLSDAYEVSVHGRWASGDPDGPRLRSDVQARQAGDEALRVQGDALGDHGNFPLQVTYLTHLSTLRWGGLYVRVQNHVLQGRMMGLEPILSFDSDLSTKQLHGGEVGYQHTVGDWHLKGRAALDGYLRDIDLGLFPPFQFLPTRAVEDNRTKLTFNGMVADVAASAARRSDRWWTLLGTQYRQLNIREVAFTFTNDGTVHPLAPEDDATIVAHDANLFAQGGVKAHDALELLAGLRGNLYKPTATDFEELAPAEADPDPKFHLMGRAGVVAHAGERVSVKALWGRSFRLPTALEAYASIRTVVAPNPTIDPELMDTYELAVEMRPVDELFWRVNGFYSVDRDAIEFAANPVTGEEDIFQNLGGFHMWGAESNFDWHANRWLNLFGSAAFTEGYREFGGQEFYMTDVPRLVANGGVVLRPLGNDELSVAPFVWYRGPFYDRERGNDVWNLTVRWQPRDWLSVTAHGENLFNEPVYEPIYVSRTAPQIDAEARRAQIFRLGVSARF